MDPVLANLAREHLRVTGDSAALRIPVAAPTRRQGRAEDPAGARAASDADAERFRSERIAVERAGPGSPDDRPSTVSPAYAEDERPFARGRPRRRGLFAAVLAVLAIAMVGFAILDHELTNSGVSANGRSPTRIEPIPVQRTADARQNRRTIESPRAGAGIDSPHSTKPPVQPKKRLHGVRSSEFATRLFVWPAVSRATFYRVEFFRRGRKIFKASPTSSRIELPLRWVFRGRHFRLTPATYRWEVRAAFGPRSRPRYGKFITRSMWTAQ